MVYFDTQSRNALTVSRPETIHVDEPMLGRGENAAIALNDAVHLSQIVDSSRQLDSHIVTVYGESKPCVGPSWRKLWAQRRELTQLQIGFVILVALARVPSLDIALHFWLAGIAGLLALAANAVTVWKAPSAIVEYETYPAFFGHVKRAGWPCSESEKGARFLWSAINYSSAKVRKAVNAMSILAFVVAAGLLFANIFVVLLRAIE